jgi:hypothetical protein
MSLREAAGLHLKTQKGRGSGPAVRFRSLVRRVCIGFRGGMAGEVFRSFIVFIVKI